MRHLLPVLLLLLAFTCAVCAEPVTIGGVTYAHVDPGEAFTAAPQPVQDWQPPAPSAAELAAGLLAFVAPDPGDYRPYRLPKPEEHLSRLTAALTPGAAEAVCFAVRTLTPLQGLTVTVDMGGAPVTADVRQMHCWPQRTGWRSRQWYLTPELLLPCAGGKKTVPAQRGVLQEVAFDVPADTTQGFWITLRAPAEAKAGTYRGSVTVTSTGKAALRLPLQVTVLPFTLQRPADRSWLIYCDAFLWRNMSDAQVLSVLKDYAAHGMNGLISMPFGSPDLSQLKQGKVTFDASPYRKVSALCRQAGMAGPHVIGSAGPEAVAQALGLKVNLNKGDWPAEVKTGVQAVARAAVEATTGLPRWYYYGVDEPTGENTYAIQDYQAWHDGGALTYATFYVPSFLEKASAYLTAPCFVVGLISSERNAGVAREACEKTGAEFWWYGTGSYVNPFPQEGFMFHNRYGAGLLFWKTGARSEATWTFCRPHEDVFNDFDGSRANSAEPKEQCTAYPHLLKPDDYSTWQGAIPTIAWESLREGVDDYCYLYTLTQLIKQAAASTSPAAREAATAAKGELEALVNTVPWANPMGGVAFEASRLQQVRRLVADRIIGLQNVLAGRAAAPEQATAQQFMLSVTTSAAPSRPPLPTLALPAAPAAPNVDGRLDPAEWKAAATVGNFLDIRDGAPSRLATRAYAMADDMALYVALDCPEPAMGKVAAKETQHDGTVWLEDGAEIFVGAASRETYAHVIVTTANVVLDERNQDAQAWNPKLATAVQKRADGWSVEIALPWAELAQAGVAREPLMTFNLCRSRYTESDPQAHTAWSPTYGGFHVPERFGLALLPTAPVALQQLSLPTRWGREALRATVANAGREPVVAEVSVGRDQTRAALGRGQRFVAPFPVQLYHPGKRSLRLSWGVAGGQPAAIALPVTVPEPVEVPACGGVLSPGDVLNLPVRLNLSPYDQERHTLRLRLSCAGSGASWQRELPATPGQSLRLPVRLAGMARLQVVLANQRGREVWQSPQYALMVLPE